MAEHQEVVVVNNVSNLTLLGVGKMETGSHETVKQSTVIVRCLNSVGGLVLINSSDISFEAITVTGCGSPIPGDQFGGYGTVSLAFVYSFNTHLSQISVQNGSGFGLVVINCFNITIEGSSFYRNQYPLSDDDCTALGIFYCPAGNAFIAYTDLYLDNASSPVQMNNNKLGILRSNFSFGYGLTYGLGSGLKIEFTNAISFKVDIVLDGIVAYGNSALVGANIEIGFYNGEAYYSIIVNNTVSVYANTIIPISQLDQLGPALIQSTMGGGLYFVHSSDYTKGAEFSIYNSEFSHNQAVRGGGLVIAWGTNTPGQVTVESCTFRNNTGGLTSALYVFLNTDFAFNQVHPNFVFRNTTVDSNRPSMLHNSSLQSAITIQSVPVVVFDGIVVSNNPTTGLSAFGSNLVFEGLENRFVGNAGTNGGGMALYGNTYLVLRQPVVLYFTDNHASNQGGGLYVSQAIIPNNVQCFFQTVNSQTLGGPLRIEMAGNTANISGTALYGGEEIDSCNGLIPYQLIFQFHNQPGLSVVSSNPLSVCFCNEYGEVDCDMSEYFTTAEPGRLFSIPVGTVGNMDGLTPAVVRVNITNSTLNPSVVFATTSGKCTNLNYTLIVKDANQTKVEIILSLESVPAARLTPPPQRTVKVTALPCPIGFEHSSTLGICDCSHQLTSMLPGVSCNILTGDTVREGGVWLGYDNISNCTIVSSNCPLDYCREGTVTFQIIDPDPQCALNRSGVLCGGCAQGLSLMLGSNRCGECSNASLSLLLPFALAGFALVTLLIILNLTVSVGAVNGLIFYANIVKLGENVFFPNSPIPVFLSQFISWVNLDLGIETCFFHGMTGCGKIWLQFLFPMYLWLILILIIVLARYSQRLLQLVGSRVVPVLATLLLLSFTKLTRTVIQALYLTQISCNDQKETVWYFDGNVIYFSGCHLPLVIVSLLVLVVFIIPYTLFLLTSPLIEKYFTRYKCFRWIIRLKPILDAYGGPYKDRYRFWTGFLLLVRLILALVASLSGSASVTLNALMSTLVILLTLHYISGDVYSKKYLSILEVTFLLNLILLGYFASEENARRQLQAEYSSETVAAIVLIAISFITFIGILIFHLFLRFMFSSPLNNCLDKLKLRIQRKGIKGSGSLLPDAVTMVNSTLVSFDERRRETMLLDSDFHEFDDKNNIES